MLIHDCEQNTPEWFALRAGLPTASEFKKLVTSTGLPSKSLADYAIELAADKYAGEPLDNWEGNSSTERGHELEQSARDAYSLDHDIDVTQVGFVTDDLGRWGCSPDGLVGTDGILEIKCFAKKNHTKALMYIDDKGTVPPDQIAQVQGQMLICERIFCDLLFYHPKLPSRLIHAVPDYRIVDPLLKQLAAVEARRNIVMQTYEDK